MVAHTTNCPGGTCDDPETTFLCDVCGRECAACCGVAESETCDDCEGNMELARLTDRDGDEFTLDASDNGVHAIHVMKYEGVYSKPDECIAGIYASDALKLLDSANLNTTANELRAKLEEAAKENARFAVWLAESGCSAHQIARIASGATIESDDLDCQD